MKRWELRYWSKVEKRRGDSCWLWTGYKQPNGYGLFSLNGKDEYAHRISHELRNGPIENGYVIDHTCHVTACCNPAHLRVVTNKQNQEHRAGPTVANTSGARGVSWHKPSQKWFVSVKHNSKSHYGGIFTDLQEAAEAAKQLRLSLFSHNDADRNPA